MKLARGASKALIQIFVGSALWQQQNVQQYESEQRLSIMQGKQTYFYAQTSYLLETEFYMFLFDSICLYNILWRFSKFILFHR